MFSQFPHEGFVDISKILGVFPISKSGWWAGVKDGRYPKPIKHGGRTFWKAEDILNLIETVKKEAA